MTVRVLMVMALLLGSAGAQQLRPMAKDAKPGFEVATIKPSEPSARETTVNFEGNRFVIRNLELLRIIQFAYSLHKDQVANAPAWLKERFDIEGIPDTPGEPSVAQMQEMTRRLLSERFGLVFHREQRALPMYAMSVAKGGVKLQVSKRPEAEGPDVNVDGGAHRMSGRFTNVTLDEFALELQDLADRPVVNETGLTGRYDIVVSWNPNLADTGEMSETPPLFTAVREQLGLKMEAKKAPVTVLVIEAVSRPTAN